MSLPDLLNPLMELQLTELHWVRINWWASVLLVPIIMLLLFKMSAYNRWTNWIDEPMRSLLVKVTRKRSVTPICLGLVWLLGWLIFLGPAHKQNQLPTAKNQSPLFIIVDYSLSMLAEDIKPNRTTHTRFKITDILQNKQDGIASLIAYSGSAHMITPLTEDAQTILNQLPALKPEIFPKYGSSALEAFHLAVNALKQLSTPRGKILWFTDEASSSEIAQAAQLAKSQQQQLVLIAVGTKEGAPIPFKGSHMQDGDGKQAMSATPLEAMRQAAQQNNILFLQSTHLTASLIATLNQVIEQTQPLDTEQTQKAFGSLWQEIGYLLIPLMLLLLLPMLRNPQLFLLLIVLLPASESQAKWLDFWLTPDQQGAKLFQQEKYQQAVQEFETPEWLVASQYHSKNYQTAAANFLSQKNYYNAGNALAYSGKIKEAIAAYSKALEIDPKHADAKHNRETLLELLKQKNEQQQGEKSDDDQQSQQQKGEQSDQQGESKENQKDGKQGEKSDDNQQSEQQDGKQQKNNQALSGDKSHLEQEKEQQEKDQQDKQQADKSGDKPEDDKPENEQQEQDSAGNPKQNQDSPDDTTTPTATRTITQQLSPQDIEKREKKLEFKQWIRSMPDNPSLLLQRKFEHQYKAQRQDGFDNKSQKLW